MDELTELLDRLDMADYLDAHSIEYRETVGTSGPQLQLKECPVCGSSKWKTYLSAETGRGNCFAGSHPPGENFSKWKFIKALLPESNNRQVVDHIRQFVSMRGWRPKRTRSAPVMQTAELVLPESVPIPIEGKNLKYLANRGITAEVAQYFHMRYCHQGYWRFRGLDGGWKFVDFGKRILIPIFDLDGKMVSFQGRDITGTAERKYLFPSGLPATGVHLFNGLNVRNTRRVVIGEGVFDVAALKIALDEDPDLRDVVPIGTFGKHLSLGPGDTQRGKFIRLKEERGLEEVTIMWDGEIAATEAAIKAGWELLGLGLRVRIAMLPPDKDPNEVPASVVRRAFYEAETLTRVSGLAIQMKRRKLNLSAV